MEVDADSMTRWFTENRLAYMLRQRNSVTYSGRGRSRAGVIATFDTKRLSAELDIAPDTGASTCV